MRTLTLKVIVMTLSLLFLCSYQSLAQDDLQAKSGSELISENDTSGNNIPADFPLDKQASIYAKRQAKKLGLDNVQVLRLTVRRLAYLKKLEQVQLDASLDSIEAKKERVSQIRKEYYSKFYELLTPNQRTKALQAEEIAKH